MVKVSLLFISVLTLFCFLIPGFILRKAKLADNGFAKALSVFTLYVAQVSMILHGFMVEFNFKVLKGLGLVFIFGLIAHIVFYILAKNLFRKAPEKLRIPQAVFSRAPPRISRARRKIKKEAPHP